MDREEDGGGPGRTKKVRKTGMMASVEMDEMYESCTLCPRNCRVNRLQGERGFCGQSAPMKAAWAGLHLGEEPALLGAKGSGTVFFAGCTLKCGYCQNCQLSRRGLGREISPGELRVLMLRLQERGAANINLVTASHFAPAIVESVAAARQAGLCIPVVWNSSGYEQLSTLELLGQTVDIYLPDCKTLDGRLSRRLMGAAHYPEVARKALVKMVADKPLVVEGGQVRQGVILQYTPVRPGAQCRGVAGSQVSEASAPGHTVASCAGSGPVPAGIAVPSRAANRRECQQVLAWLGELEIEDGFVQEPARGEDWLPDFTRPNPFPAGQAGALWHFAKGYLD
jgi:putative pyruvate formate lyase activating enzyme